MDLKFENLTKKYGTRTVLDIPQGHVSTAGITAVIGPNGAGKSTLINVIAGLSKPTKGTVYYEGRDKNCFSEVTPYEDITLVFQKPYLISTTVGKNIGYPLKLRHWKEEDIKKRSHELMEALGLLELEKQKSWKLSGGETQKAALARALAFRPRLLLLDEPTANVDPVTTGEIEEMLKNINQKEGIAVMIITHNLAQARRLSSSCVFMHKGKILEQGDSDRILREPEHPLTRNFIQGELLI